MTIRDRVVAIVRNWCGFGGFPTSNALSVLWSQSSQATAIPFSPQALLLLISGLQSEFRNPKPDLRDLSGLNANAFAPAGSINAVDDLVSAVMFAPVPQAVHAMIAGFAHDGARNELVNAIADEVAKRMGGPAPKGPKKPLDSKRAEAKEARERRNR